ncbi:hypothetical protein K458DRAFT_119337 [Lentithecium fluviatile CBS 122367]|uniref:Uncharacterized protein n=1 Tax=Lentithecium fluviatile CBS 122367 TaxID=1168545 RepID=A0A6G1IMR6_9PLEO|nr:hypothetical protein K458DRAFT_119337 [Lentithecium fluviatile CBS 122367]
MWECTITLHGAQMIEKGKLRVESKLLGELGLFDYTFLDNLALVPLDMASLSVSPLGQGTQVLCCAVVDEGKRLSYALEVGYLEGDEVTDVNRPIKQGEGFSCLIDCELLADWGYTLSTLNATWAVLASVWR